MGLKRYGKIVWPGFKNAPSERHIKKVGRNDPCPCGSGKKYKVCHESEGTKYLEKLAKKEEKERIKKLRRRLKEEGVPWYKRLFLLR